MGDLSSIILQNITGLSDKAWPIKQRSKKHHNQVKESKMRDNREARTAYKNSMTDVKNLLKMIAESVKEHGRKQSAQEIHYGHVGDMNEIRRKLMEVMMSMNLPSDMWEDEYLDNLSKELELKRNTK